jgi:hypothetical protein
LLRFHPGEGRLWLTGARLLAVKGGPVHDAAAVLVADRLSAHRRPPRSDVLTAFGCSAWGSRC